MVDPAAGARTLLEELVGEDRVGWGPSARAQRVRDLFALKERTEAALLAAVAEWDAGKDWALDGQLSAPTWLAWQAPVTKAAGGRVVADAEFLRGHDDIAARLAAGALSCAHVTAMAKAALHHETEFAICKDSLVGSAREMNPTDFAAVMAGWAKMVDDRPPRQHGDRGFRIRELMDGWGVPDGLLDPELCALFQRCLKDLAPPDPLDAGRQARQFNRAQRRAMAHRDGGCAFPGCDRPPQWCDAHHLDFWDADHGDTDLDRGCLLCRRHHKLLHKRGWALDRDIVTGIFTATAPDGRTFTHDPRKRQAPPRPRPPAERTEGLVTTAAPPAERQPSRC